jgi:hypothetical protein
MTIPRSPASFPSLRYASKILKEAEFSTGNAGLAGEPAKAVNAVLLAGT